MHFNFTAWYVRVRQQLFTRPLDRLCNGGGGSVFSQNMDIFISVTLTFNLEVPLKLTLVQMEECPTRVKMVKQYVTRRDLWVSLLFNL